eukprot:Nitzschia sp. Nitz4//scaffold248_size28759//25809//27806//NITZ4_008112-RA/size28759-processed-gene-0.14-mRNA-1//1//CDS//3329544001//1826//frame0
MLPSPDPPPNNNLLVIRRTTTILRVTLQTYGFHLQLSLHLPNGAAPTMKRDDNANRRVSKMGAPPKQWQLGGNETSQKLEPSEPPPIRIGRDVSTQQVPSRDSKSRVSGEGTRLEPPRMVYSNSTGSDAAMPKKQLSTGSSQDAAREEAVQVILEADRQGKRGSVAVSSEVRDKIAKERAKMATEEESVSVAATSTGPPPPPASLTRARERPGAYALSPSVPVRTRNTAVDVVTEEIPVQAPAADDLETDTQIQAELIDAEADRERLKETLQDVLGTQTATQVVDLEAEHRLKQERQQRNQRFFCVLSIFLVAIVVIAVFVAVRNNRNPPTTESPTAMPSMVPTAAPTARIDAVVAALETEFDIIPLDDPPRAKAVDYLTFVDTTIKFPIDLDDEDESRNIFEKYVVAVLAYSTAFEYWERKTNWLSPDVSVCEWEGLGCNDDGELAVIDLAIQNMTGTIPPELGKLEELDLLFMFRNNLRGTIPTEIGKLAGVEIVYLHENQLSGPIPEEIEDLIKTEELYLYGNHLTGTIPNSLGKLVDMVHIALYDNELTGTIPTALQGLKRIETIQLQNNSLTGTIPSHLSGIAELERLYLHRNALSGTVPTELGSFQNFRLLTIYDNMITGTMPAEICNLREKGELDRLVVLEADCLESSFNCTCCSACW